MLKHKQSEEEWGRRDQEPIPSSPEIVEDLLNPREQPWLYLAKEDKAKP